MTVGPLAAGIAVAPAAAKTTNHKHTIKAPKPKTISTTCSDSVTIAIAPGDTAVTPPVSDGTQYGPVRCGPLGRGVEVDTFSLQDTGDLAGTFVQYFGAGTLHGTFDLTPSDNQQPSDTGTFAMASYTGTGKVLGGTGVDKNATGSDTLTCSSPDGIQMSCTIQLKLKLPAPKSS
jgi:hypothetical protein